MKKLFLMCAATLFGASVIAQTQTQISPVKPADCCAYYTSHLNLNPQQKSSFEAIMNHQHQQMQQIKAAGGTDMKTKIDALHNDTDLKVKSLLGEEKYNQYVTLKKQMPKQEVGVKGGKETCPDCKKKVENKVENKGTLKGNPNKGTMHRNEKSGTKTGTTGTTL